jgi:hypothetical protein
MQSRIVSSETQFLQLPINITTGSAIAVVVVVVVVVVEDEGDIEKLIQLDEKRTKERHQMVRVGDMLTTNIYSSFRACAVRWVGVTNDDSSRRHTHPHAIIQFVRARATRRPNGMFIVDR